jgi:predicted polyphosphate/ATP-dependent NAD kinase
MADMEDMVVPLVGLAIGAKIVSNVLDNKPRKKHKSKGLEI